MESRANSPIVTGPLNKENTADATQIADAMVSTWLEIDAALRPVIGQGGVAALYKRSLYLTTPAHTCWPAPTKAFTRRWTSPCCEPLAQQSNATAAAGSRALLHTFNELLTSLVGPSLTERLLRSVWANSFSGSPAQDSSS